MFLESTGYYVSPPVDQYLRFKNRCSLMYSNLKQVPTQPQKKQPSQGGDTDCHKIAANLFSK
jgi:hypothetical protein